MRDAFVPTRLAGQAAMYVLFMGFIGYFSFLPVYVNVDDQTALLRLSFSHGGSRKGGCRERSSEEMADLAANMRVLMDCPRERVPVVVEVELDGELLHRAAYAATGVAGDGPSAAYERFELPVGEHQIVVRLRDTERESGFDYESELTTVLGPRESLVIDFRASDNGFVFY